MILCILYFLALVTTADTIPKVEFSNRLCLFRVAFLAMSAKLSRSRDTSKWRARGREGAVAGIVKSCETFKAGGRI